MNEKERIRSLDCLPKESSKVTAERNTRALEIVAKSKEKQRRAKKKQRKRQNRRRRRSKKERKKEKRFKPTKLKKKDENIIRKKIYGNLW